MSWGHCSSLLCSACKLRSCWLLLPFASSLCVYDILPWGSVWISYGAFTAMLVGFGFGFNLYIFFNAALLDFGMKRTRIFVLSAMWICNMVLSACSELSSVVLSGCEQGAPEKVLPFLLSWLHLVFTEYMFIFWVVLMMLFGFWRTERTWVREACVFQQRWLQ